MRVSVTDLLAFKIREILPRDVYLPFSQGFILVKSLNRQASRRPCEWRRRCVAAAAGVSMRRYSNAWICTSLYTCVVDTCSRLVTKIAGKGYDCIKIVSEEMLGFYKCIEMAHEWACLVRGCVQCLLSQNPAKVLIVEIYSTKWQDSDSKALPN